MPSSTARARPVNEIPAKRKADDDARPSEQKQPRLAPNANGSARLNVDAPKASRPAERPSSGYTGSARPSTAAATNNNRPRPLTEKPASAASKKPSSTAGGKPSPTTATFSTASRPATSTNSSLSRPVPLSKPAGNDAAAGSAAKAPKKGSYAEIKARAAAQAQKLQTIGKIQHRAVEKQSTKKEQDVEDARLVKKGVKPGSKPVSAAPSKDGLHSSGNGVPDRSSKGLERKAGSRGAATAEERKPKKAALATTGYSGSARPPPSKAKPGAAKLGSGRDRARRPNPLGMFSRPRPRDDEYDEDMDDFIDDDDDDEPEDEGYGRRYRYADGDDDSDMEAGYSDVEDEEEAAARLARLEDQREEAILEQRRREKEARKRAAAGR